MNNVTGADPKDEPKQKETSQTDPERGIAVLDELNETLGEFRVLRKQNSAEADALLASMGANSKVDRKIILELSATRPIGRPEQFLEAHIFAVRSLEVLARNGSSGVPVPKLGPVKPVAKYLIEQVTRFIVRSYLANAVDAMTKLYVRREAETERDDPSYMNIRRARLDAQRMAPGFKGNPLGIPTFLIGGAFLSSALSAARSLGSLASKTSTATVLASLAVALIFAGLSWTALRGAAVARRRISLTAEKALAALWEAIGRCGDPPKDQSRTFATIAVVATGFCWLVIPIGIVIAIL